MTTAILYIHIYIYILSSYTVRRVRRGTVFRSELCGRRPGARAGEFESVPVAEAVRPSVVDGVVVDVVALRVIVGRRAWRPERPVAAVVAGAVVRGRPVVFVPGRQLGAVVLANPVVRRQRGLFRELWRFERRRRRRRAESFVAVVVESARVVRMTAPVELRTGPAGRAEQSVGQHFSF